MKITHRCGKDVVFVIRVDCGGWWEYIYWCPACKKNFVILKGKEVKNEDDTG
jgi:hypothetical protein